jgi:hypothetical protein
MSQNIYRRSIRRFCAIWVALIFCISCNEKPVFQFPAEPDDPDTYDLTDWESVNPGVHSGFGSIDTFYSKSIPPVGEISGSVNLQGWKGERVNCKLLVWTSGNEGQISIEASDLEKDNFKIAKENISVSVMRYVLVDQFQNEKSGSCGSRDNDKMPVHIRPDLLSGENIFKIDGPGTRPVWISVDIPADAPAGIYTGIISRISKSGIENHVIELEVINKRLPDPSEWTFRLDLWQNPFAVARYHGVELWSAEHIDLLKPLLKKLAGAGQKCITTIIIEKPWNGEAGVDPFRSMIKWTKKSNGTWNYDYKVFDTYVNLAMECGINGQINCYSVIPITNKFTWFDEKIDDIVVTELIPGTEEYEALMTNFLGDFKSHLKEKGWMDKTFLALDEREETEMKNLFEFLHETAPEFRISMAGFYYESINSSIHDFSSNWRDGGRIPEEAIKSREKSGLITTYYVACGIPKPNNFTFSLPSESCYEGWLAAAMGFDGFLRWAYNTWPENPLIDSRYIKWPSGDMYLVYPGALSSVRFERLRDGIQDYEKIRILRKELAENTSPEAASAMERLDNFLRLIDSKTLDKRSAAEVINEGKQLLYEIAKSAH